MNKELIKTYKAEFDHWLDGGKVQVFYKKDTLPRWITDDECISCEDVDNFSHILQNSLEPEDVLIAIDDYYSEFRKALAEGKTIQYYVDSFVGWQEVNTLKQSFMHPNNFRISPEEPKFKVGDWVVNTKRHNSNPFLADDIWISHIKEHDRTIGGTTARTGNLEDFEIWQPKPGEWCWFLNSNREPVLKQFLQMCSIVPTNYVSKQGTISGSVEPFIGELPTFLKDV